MYSGLTRALKDTFYPHLRPLGNEARRKRLSSMRDGDTFHRHVYHVNMCRNTCNCHRLFRKRYRKLSPCSKINRWIASLDKYLVANGYEIIELEKVLTSREIMIYTRLDMLCRDKNTDQTVLISLKTGSNVLSLNRCRGTPDVMSGQAARSLGLKCTELNAHLLQIFFEKEMLKNININIDKCLILYFGIAGAKKGEDPHVVEKTNWGKWPESTLWTEMRDRAKL